MKRISASFLRKIITEQNEEDEQNVPDDGEEQNPLDIGNNLPSNQSKKPINIFGGSNRIPQEDEPQTSSTQQSNSTTVQEPVQEPNIIEPQNEPKVQSQQSQQSNTQPDTNQQPEQQPIETKQITTQEAKDLIKNSRGRFFTVTFTKRGDGTTRIMNARLGVKAYLKGGELPFNAEAKGLIPVFDMQKKDYRLVPFDNVSKIKIGNIEYIVS